MACGAVWLDGSQLQELIRRAEAEEKDESRMRVAGMLGLGINPLGVLLAPVPRR